MLLREVVLLSTEAIVLVGIQGLIYLIGVIVIVLYATVQLSFGWRNFVLKTWAFVQPFGFAALAVGWLAGDSRVPVLGTVLPAVLTFLGGFFVFVFGQDLQAKAFVLVAVPLVSFMLFVGTGIGAAEREYFNSSQDVNAGEKLNLRLQQAAEAELAYGMYRTNAGLGPTGPITIEIIRSLLGEKGDGAQSKP
jgi:hypothetical protein